MSAKIKEEQKVRAMLPKGLEVYLHQYKPKYIYVLLRMRWCSSAVIEVGAGEIELAAWRNALKNLEG